MGRTLSHAIYLPSEDTKMPTLCILSGSVPGSQINILPETPPSQFLSLALSLKDCVVLIEFDEVISKDTSAVKKRALLQVLTEITQRK